MARLASITDVRSSWTFADLADAHALLDARELAERRAEERARGRR